MTVLYVIGTILRFLLRIALLPVQAALTLMLLAIDFASGLIGIAFTLAGDICIIGGIIELCSKTGSTTIGIEGLIGGLCFAVIPQAIALWGETAILGLKELLARV